MLPTAKRVDDSRSKMVMYYVTSLRSKRSRTTRTKIRAARKVGREQKGEKSSPDFEFRSCGTGTLATQAIMSLVLDIILHVTETGGMLL